MNRRFVILTTAFLGAAWFASGPPAARTTTNSTARIEMHPTHYVFDGIGYTDLNKLDAAVRARPYRTIELASCTTDAHRAWSAAVARFTHFTLQLTHTPKSTCAAVPVSLPVGLSNIALPSGIDDASVRRYWEQVAP